MVVLARVDEGRLMWTFSPVRDLSIVVAVYALLLGGALWWVHRSGQKLVDRGWNSSIRMASRLALLAIPLVAFCAIANLAPWIFLIPLLFCLPFLSSHQGLVISGPGVVLFFLVEFVLGFPVTRDALFLLPEEESKVDNPLAGLVGHQATCRTALKPAGEVTLAGEQYPARCVTGGYIEAESLVEVVKAEGGTLVVRQTDTVVAE